MSDIVKVPNKADKKMNPRRKIPPLETFLIRDDRRGRDHFGCQTITIFRGLIVPASKLMGILLLDDAGHRIIGKCYKRWIRMEGGWARFSL